jgi:initiation factor 1A
MPKNTRKQKNSKNKKYIGDVRVLITKGDCQEYATVLRMLGGSRVECELITGDIKLGLIRNKMRRGAVNKIKISDIILVSLRDFQDSIVDVIHVYNQTEVDILKTKGYIPTVKEHFEDIMFVSEESINSDAINFELI